MPLSVCVLLAVLFSPGALAEAAEARSYAASTPDRSVHLHRQALGPGGLHPRSVAIHPGAGGKAMFVGEGLALPGFKEALVSWNIRLTPTQAAVMDVRVERETEAGREVSPWLSLASWRGARASAEPEWGPTRFEGGRIDVDYFVSDQTWQRIAYRVRLLDAAGAGARPASLERVDITATLDAPSPNGGDAADSGGRVALYVPFRSQMTEREEIAGRICSPTSVAMVLAYHGADTPVLRAAEVIYDARHDLYGNWPRAVQGAFEMGVGGYLTRFDDWRSVRETLANGTPIIASIRVKEGELPEAPYPKTAGHLIVITGLDGAGGVLVNDPAVADPQAGRLVYPMRAMEQVWMRGSKGTAYVLTGPAGAE